MKNWRGLVAESGRQTLKREEKPGTCEALSDGAPNAVKWRLTAHKIRGGSLTEGHRGISFDLPA